MKTSGFYVGDGASLLWDFGGKKYRLDIQRDESPCDPREWGRVGVMACFHRSYRLGDKIDGDTPEEFWQGLVKKNVSSDEIFRAAENGELDGIRIAKSKDAPGCYDVYETCYLAGYQARREVSECLEYSEIEKDLVADYIMDDLTVEHCQRLLGDNFEWMRLWYFDHSVFKIACANWGNPFCDPWDSGQLGWIVASKDDVIKTGIGKPEHWRLTAAEIMRGEVAEYGAWAEGDVYGYTLYADSGDGWNIEDACWSFFGDDVIGSGMADSVGHGLREAIDSGACESVSTDELEAA